LKSLISLTNSDATKATFMTDGCKWLTEKKELVLLPEMVSNVAKSIWSNLEV
jgi:hypothetical protein